MDNGNKLLARINSLTGNTETLLEHTANTMRMCGIACKKIGCPAIGEYVACLHDMGKSRSEWQNYLRNGGAKIDHSTYGADWVKHNITVHDRAFATLAESIICGHHGGLDDLFDKDGEDKLGHRLMNLRDSDIYEANTAFCREIFSKSKIEQLESDAVKEFHTALEKMSTMTAVSESKDDRRRDLLFSLSLWTRFVLSALIDSDRYDACYSLLPEKMRPRDDVVDWESVSSYFENYINTHFVTDINNPISCARRDISYSCKISADRPNGIYRLSAPTGSGKTYASFRFALNRVKARKNSKILYIAPFKTILEQTADNLKNATKGVEIFEHHSDITDRDEAYDLYAERWNAPIILTTMVQFLDTLFNGSNTCARRMHQLADSVIIIDEPQSIPIECTWMLNLALRFLSEFCKSTILLMTATPPPTDKMKRHRLAASPFPEIAPNKSDAFISHRNIQIEDMTSEHAFNAEKLAELIVRRYKDDGSLLCIVNTKSAAMMLYNEVVKRISKDDTFFLTTDLCAAHRSDILQIIRERLKSDEKSHSVLCISTQLIEAGVDLSFRTVVRSLAGMDSITQAAGRCNRDGRYGTGNLIIVRYTDEKLDKLQYLIKTQIAAKAVLDMFRTNPNMFDSSLLSRKSTEAYYQRLYSENERMLGFPDNDYLSGSDLFEMLSANKFNPASQNTLCQAFGTAGSHFHVIEPGGISVIVPYKRGAKIIESLMTVSDITEIKRLLNEAQRYSVNIRKYNQQRLSDAGLLIANTKIGFYCVNSSAYDPEKLGLIKDYTTGNAVII